MLLILFKGQYDIFHPFLSFHQYLDPHIGCRTEAPPDKSPRVLLFLLIHLVTLYENWNFEIWWFHRKDLVQIYQNILYFKFLIVETVRFLHLINAESLGHIKQGRGLEPHGQKPLSDKNPSFFLGKNKLKHRNYIRTKLPLEELNIRENLIQKSYPVPHENHWPWVWNPNASEASYKPEQLS